MVYFMFNGLSSLLRKHFTFNGTGTSKLESMPRTHLMGLEYLGGNSQDMCFSVCYHQVPYVMADFKWPAGRFLLRHDEFIWMSSSQLAMCCVTKSLCPIFLSPEASFQKSMFQNDKCRGIK